MGWLSHVEEEGENGNKVEKPTLQQNGAQHKGSDPQSILDGVEEVNGNLVESDGKASFGIYKDISNEEDLNSQYQKAKVPG